MECIRITKQTSEVTLSKHRFTGGHNIFVGFVFRNAEPLQCGKVQLLPLLRFPFGTQLLFQ